MCFKAALESKDKEQEALREAHSVELLKKDKKLAQLKELAMAKAKALFLWLLLFAHSFGRWQATEKLKERDAMILRLKKEKLRLTQEREEEMEALVRQHRAESEELTKQLRAKTEALGVLRGMLAELENQPASSGAGASSAAAADGGKAKASKADNLLKLQNIQLK